MVESDGTPQNKTDSVPFETPPPVVESALVVGGKWKLPEGIENHIETGLINSAIGGIAGGLFGLVAFRAGGGWRFASAAAGIGVGIGSTLERAKVMPKFK